MSACLYCLHKCLQQHKLHERSKNYMFHLSMCQKYETGPTDGQTMEKRSLFVSLARQVTQRYGIFRVI